MKRHCRAVAVLLGALVAVATTAGASEMTDAYEILANHYEAIGGLDRLRSEATMHFEATLSVVGLEGTVRYWEARPDRNRTEVDLGVFAQTTGDNGTTSWEVDANGKLRIEKDEEALKRRRVAALMAGYEHLDPASDVFTVTSEGTQGIGGFDCYVVRISNSIEETDALWYIDTETFLLRKTATVGADEERHALLSDFREVAGVLRPFRQEIELRPIGQEQTLTVTRYEVNPELDPSIFDPPEDDARDFTFIDGGRHAEIPFKFIENHVFLPVTVNCRESLWVLDTGASVTVIDTEYARELGLRTEGQIKGQGAGNAVDVSFTTLPGFSVRGIEFEEQNVAAVAIADLFRKTTELEIAGILGYDFLSRFVTRVDFANETLVFYDPETFSYEGDGVVLDAPLKGNIFTTPAVVDGEYAGRWTLDLGAGRTTFHAPFAQEHGLLTRESIASVGFGAGGRVEKRTSRYDSIELAGFTIEDPLISTALPVADLKGAFGSTETTGNLGNSLFRHFVLYLDYERQQVVVERGDDFAREFPEDKSGLAIWRPEMGPYEVLFVSPGTPAEDAGFLEGDVVHSVNGIPIDHLDGLLAIREMLRGDEGKSFVFEVERGGHTEEITLTLRRIL